jgi:hypothetical protein
MRGRELQSVPATEGDPADGPAGPPGHGEPPVVDVRHQLRGHVGVEVGRRATPPGELRPTVDQHEKHRADGAGRECVVHHLPEAEFEEERDRVRPPVQQVDHRVPPPRVLAVPGR